MTLHCFQKSDELLRASLVSKLSEMRDHARSDLESAERDLETANEVFRAAVINMPGQAFSSDQRIRNGVLRYLYDGGLLRAQRSESSTSQQVKCAKLHA